MPTVKTQTQSHVESEVGKNLNARHHLKILSRFVKSGKILEIGCGPGYFLAEASKTGFEPYGVELNQHSVHYARRVLGLNCQDQPLSEASFPGTIFDVVYHCDVLSHLPDPISDFMTIAKKLKGGGYMLFETGNIADVKDKYFHLFPGFSYPDHLFFFGESSVQDLLKKTGFELIRMYRYNIIPQFYFLRLIKVLRLSSRTPAGTSPSERQNVHRSASTGDSALMKCKRVLKSVSHFLQH